MSDAQKPRGMTADELQAIVRKLANASWCRYWLMWRIRPWEMAVHCIESDGVAVSVESLEPYRADVGQFEHFYVIPRLNEDGTPFTSPLQ